MLTQEEKWANCIEEKLRNQNKVERRKQRESRKEEVMKLCACVCMLMYKVLSYKRTQLYATKVKQSQDRNNNNIWNGKW